MYQYVYVYVQMRMFLCANEQESEKATDFTLCYEPYLIFKPILIWELVIGDRDNVAGASGMSLCII